MEQEPATGPGAHNYITQYQLHKDFGVGKATINRAVKAGKLQLHDRPDGTKRVFVPEAMQVFQDLIKKGPELVGTTQHRNETAASGTSEEIAKLALELALARQELAHKDEIIRRIEDHKADIEKERDHLREDVATLKALPAPAAIAKPGFLTRLLGRTA